MFSPGRSRFSYFHTCDLLREQTFTTIILPSLTNLSRSSSGVKVRLTLTNVFSTFREAIVIYKHNTKLSKVLANYHTLAVNENGVVMVGTIP